MPNSNYPYEPYNKYKRLEILHDQDNIMYDMLNNLKIADIQCEADHNKILYEQILGTDNYYNEALVYTSCKHTIVAAAKRQMKSAPLPDYNVAKDFLEHSKMIIEKEVGEELNQFKYSFKDWLNHLNRSKQQDMIKTGWVMTKDERLLTLTPQELKIINDEKYHGIAKIELEDMDGKPRMVCSIPKKTKYIMGPPVWHLEEIFQNKLRGYCGGKNLTEMADMINEYIKLGFVKVAEGDGSSFDNTQDVMLKSIDRYIYDRIKDKIHHVDKNLFIKESQKVCKTMSIDTVENKKIKTLFTYKILGTVFSGDCDTTLMNTTRMLLYLRYIHDKFGLKYGQDYIVIAKGDDFTTMYKNYITDEQINEIFYKYFLKSTKDPSKVDDRTYGLGQVLKFLDIGGPEIIKFCSLRSWFKNDEEIILTRDPSKFTKLSMYSRKTKFMNYQQKGEYLLDQAVAILNSYKDIEYFRIMAEIYVREAIKNFNLSQIYEKMTKYKKKKIQIILTKEERKKIDKEIYKYINIIDEEDYINNVLYDIGHRNKIYNIDDDKTYWEYMKTIEKQRTDTMTEDEKHKVDNQIALEFDIEYLKSKLGYIDLKNEQF